MRRNDKHQDNVLRALIREYNIFAGLPGSLPGRSGGSSGARYSGIFHGIRGAEVDPKAMVTRTRKGSGTLTAIIMGDSQSGGALGTSIASDLSQLGYSVTRDHQDGARGAAVISQLPSPERMPDLVVAIFGGNDPSTSSAVSAAEQMYDRTSSAGSFLIIIGPAPVTMITRPDRAGEVFAGSIGPNPSPDAWFTHDGGRYAELRVSIAQALEDSMMGNPDVAVYGIAARMSPPDYPDQPDGIHVYNGADVIASEILDVVDIEKITDAIKENIAAAEGNRDGASVPFDYDRWLREISKIEGNYDSVNPDSVALGKYQFVPFYWWDEIKAFAGSRLPNTHEVTRYTRKDKPIYDDYEAFLRDPQLQEDWMHHYTMSYAIPAAQTIRREFPEETANRSDGQLAALYHFQGLGGARDWFSRGVMHGADVNAINPDQYMDRVS